MRSIENRIEKIEKELAIEDKTEWLKLPDPDNPGQTIEIKGCKTLADFLLRDETGQGKKGKTVWPRT